MTDNGALLGAFWYFQFDKLARDLNERLRVRNIVCALLMNRPVRTRMPGGVGRAG